MARLFRIQTGRSLLASYVLLVGLAVATPPRPLQSVPIAAGNQARASIVLGEGASPPYRYAATQLQKYLYDLSGAQISIISNSQASARPKQETLIFVGGPLVNSAVAPQAEKLGLNLSTLKAGGFVIKTGRVMDHAAVVAAGRDGISTMYPESGVKSADFRIRGA